MTQDEILDDFEELVQRTADAIGIDLDEALASCYTESSIGDLLLKRRRAKQEGA